MRVWNGMRNCEGAALDRRNAEDAAAKAERAVYAAQLSVDEIAKKVRGGTSTADDLATARKKLEEAQVKLTEERARWQKWPREMTCRFLRASSRR